MKKIITKALLLIIGANVLAIRFLLLPTLLFLSVSTFAQNHLLGIKGGVSWSNIKSNDMSSDGYRTGFTAGLTYENKINEYLLIGGEIAYQQRGHQVFVQWTDAIGNPINEGDKTKFKCDYIAIPIKVGYTVGHKISGFAMVGFVPSFLLNAKTELPELVKDYGISETETDMTDYVQAFDLAGLVEIGGNWMVTERIAISVSCSYQHSFTTYTNPDYFEGIDSRHYGIILSGGLKYFLK